MTPRPDLLEDLLDAAQFVIDDTDFMEWTGPDHREDVFVKIAAIHLLETILERIKLNGGLAALTA